MLTLSVSLFVVDVIITASGTLDSERMCPSKISSAHLFICGFRRSCMAADLCSSSATCKSVSQYCSRAGTGHMYSSIIMF
jgi:hypothetical protein